MLTAVAWATAAAASSRFGLGLHPQHQQKLVLVVRAADFLQDQAGCMEPSVVLQEPVLASTGSSSRDPSQLGLRLPPLPWASVLAAPQATARPSRDPWSGVQAAAAAPPAGWAVVHARPTAAAAVVLLGQGLVA